MSDTQLLFAKYDASAALDAQQRRLVDELDRHDPDAVMTANPDELTDYFVEKFRVDVPRLREEDIEVSQSDSQFDARRDSNRVVFDRSRPIYIPGTEYTFHVPYSGETPLFYTRASTYTMNPPRAVVTESEVQFRYLVAQGSDSTGIKGEFERELGRVREHLSWLENQFGPFNDGLREQVRQRLDQRRAKLVADRGTVASFGFKVRQRPDAPRTYSVATERRRAVAASPRATGVPPEPAIDDKTYETILEICAAMAKVLEQSPSTFGLMGEEDIRNNFLVQLNGQFLGSATGETFSAAGKTDILVKVDGRNVFIAECKFWDGPKSVRDALDQLLGYATWRESKVALFVFSRTGNFTGVLRKIDETISVHPAIKRRIGTNGETGFRYLLVRPDDPEREITLTVIAFDVPRPRAGPSEPDGRLPDDVGARSEPPMAAGTDAKSGLS